MDKYVEAEKRLAELLGWKLKRVGDVPTGWIDPDGRYKADRPAWCFHWSACGPLMVEHQCCLERYVRSVSARCRGYPKAINSQFLSHPDRDTAVRYVIVQAVIAKLSTQQEP
jgi:hypothetical protein